LIPVVFSMTYTRPLAAVRPLVDGRIARTRQVTTQLLLDPCRTLLAASKSSLVRWRPPGWSAATWRSRGSGQAPEPHRGRDFGKATMTTEVIAVALDTELAAGP
jgi:hypothetical protein